MHIIRKAGLEKLTLTITYRDEEAQRGTSIRLPNGLVEIDGRTGTVSDSKYILLIS